MLSQNLEIEHDGATGGTMEVFTIWVRKWRERFGEAELLDISGQRDVFHAT